MSALPNAVGQLEAILPVEWPQSLLPAIQDQLAAGNRTLVVLDDDPTGTQTVHDVTVLTKWPVDVLSRELAKRKPAFFVLTNSRSLPLEQAQALNDEIGRNLRAASRIAQRDFAVVSRSDSTLRGHYPGEVDALAKALGQQFDATLIIPFFLEGGRYTIGNTHLVAEGDRLIPAAETPFAQDAAFGYSRSDLTEWVEEKTAGRIPAASVHSISLDNIRKGGPAVVAAALRRLSDNQVCIVNAASMRDMEVFVNGLLQAEADGKRFLYRTAASFVKVRAGVLPRPLLSPDELELPEYGGALFVVGSYVPKTTTQVNALLDQADVQSCIIDAPSLLDIQRRQSVITEAIAVTDAALALNRTVVLFTSRDLVTGDSAVESLNIGQRISSSLVAIVKGLSVTPRYLVAKGGITSSDIATKALNIESATVLGQILPGVPVWRADSGSLRPGLVYIVFPGNVGDDNALVRIIDSLAPF